MILKSTEYSKLQTCSFCVSFSSSNEDQNGAEASMIGDHWKMLGNILGFLDVLNNIVINNICLYNEVCSTLAV